MKHSLPIARNPEKREAAESLLFSPLALASGLVLHERSWIPAMVPWRATEDGFVTKDVLAWYARFAEAAPGAIVVEATGIRDVPSGPLLRIGHDRFLPGLRELVRVVAEASRGRTRLFVQIIDFLRIRRRPRPSRYFSEFLVVTDRHRAALAAALDDGSLVDADEGVVRSRLAHQEPDILAKVLDARERDELARGARERVTDTHLPHIAELPMVLPTLFADAADRAKRAGFDGVELHYAHAYTMASFLSRLNGRADGYGGTREARSRLPLEVYAAVRARVGDRFTLGARFLCDESIEGGSDVDDATYFGVAFAEAGMDFLSLSTGGKFEDAKPPKIGEAAYPYTGKSGHECMPTVKSDDRGPFARNVHKQAKIRRALREKGHETPVVVAGGIGEFSLAEDILRRGDGDLIGAARQSLADPDWWRKLREGHGARIRRCEYTNYCEGLDQMHKSVTCKLWDRLALDEPNVPMSADGRRRLIAPRDA